MTSSSKSPSPDKSDSAEKKRRKHDASEEKKDKASKSKKKHRSSSSSHTKRHSDKKNALERVVVRNLYAFAVSRRSWLVMMVALVSMVLSLWTTKSVLSVKTPPQFVQLTESGRIMPIPPLSERSVPDGAILKFAAQSVKWLNTYDYVSWRDQLQSAATRFSPNGWNDYLKHLVASDNMNSVRSQHMVVSVTFDGAPTIRKQGIVKSVNSYVWLVDVPVTVHYASPAPQGRQPSQIDQSGVVHLYISRVPLQVALRGYAIQVYQFELKRPGVNTP